MIATVTEAGLSGFVPELVERVQRAGRKQIALVIVAGGSKRFYGRSIGGEPLDISGYRGIVDYDPAELVITARAGTPLSDIRRELAKNRQMLAFEPPAYGDTATIGGTVACGFSGPARPFAGAAKDFVLGVTCVNGRGEVLRFGGRVMKNVAGFDIARLMTGALGTLGVLLEVSLKVLPMPEHQQSLRVKIDNANQAVKTMNAWAGRPLPLSAACYHAGYLNLRMSGKAATIARYADELQLDRDDQGNDYWRDLAEHRLAFFDSAAPLWRLSVASTACPRAASEATLFDWGGAQRWLLSDRPAEAIRAEAGEQHGHATLFRGGDRSGEIFQALPEPLWRLHGRIKRAFDPHRIFNVGKIYPGL